MYKIPNMTCQDIVPSKIFSVSELSNLLKEMLEGAFPKITVEGEISNFRPNGTGHLYFTLKDKDSQISAVMFKSSASYLTFAPKDGIKVQCKGRITVYPPRGNYQILITGMTLAGEGDILKMLEERKYRLASEGLFDSQKKKPLPRFPQTIGIITSPSGAALRDIMQIIKRRNKCVDIIVLPAIVQGNEAAATIVKQLKNANDFDLCDILIVGRGGGSLEDLLPFSDEEVVKAVAESRIPVISAVGHEIDWALSDYAADFRAPTPSAAAETAVPEISSIKNYLIQKSEEIYHSMISGIEKMRLIVKKFDPENLELKFRSIEQPLLIRFDDAKEELIYSMEQKIKNIRTNIENSIICLESADPNKILERGYSVVRDKNTREIICSSKQTKAGRILEIIPAAGKILASVETIENEE